MSSENQNPNPLPPPGPETTPVIDPVAHLDHLSPDFVFGSPDIEPAPPIPAMAAPGDIDPTAMPTQHMPAAEAPLPPQPMADYVPAILGLRRALTERRIRLIETALGPATEPAAPTEGGTDNPSTEAVRSYADYRDQSAQASLSRVVIRGPKKPMTPEQRQAAKAKKAAQSREPVKAPSGHGRAVNLVNNQRVNRVLGYSARENELIDKYGTYLKTKEGLDAELKRRKEAGSLSGRMKRDMKKAGRKVRRAERRIGRNEGKVVKQVKTGTPSQPATPAPEDTAPGAEHAELEQLRTHLDSLNERIDEKRQKRARSHRSKAESQNASADTEISRLRAEAGDLRSEADDLDSGIDSNGEPTDRYMGVHAAIRRHQADRNDRRASRLNAANATRRRTGRPINDSSSNVVELTSDALTSLRLRGRLAREAFTDWRTGRLRSRAKDLEFRSFSGLSRLGTRNTPLYTSHKTRKRQYLRGQALAQYADEVQQSASGRRSRLAQKSRSGDSVTNTWAAPSPDSPNLQDTQELPVTMRQEEASDVEQPVDAPPADTSPAPRPQPTESETQKKFRATKELVLGSDAYKLAGEIVESAHKSGAIDLDQYVENMSELVDLVEGITGQLVREGTDVAGVQERLSSMLVQQTALDVARSEVSSSGTQLQSNWRKTKADYLAKGGKTTDPVYRELLAQHSQEIERQAKIRASQILTELAQRPDSPTGSVDTDDEEPAVEDSAS